MIWQLARKEYIDVKSLVISFWDKRTPLAFRHTSSYPRLTLSSLRKQRISRLLGNGDNGRVL